MIFPFFKMIFIKKYSCFLEKIEGWRMVPTGSRKPRWRRVDFFQGLENETKKRKIFRNETKRNGKKLQKQETQRNETESHRKRKKRNVKKKNNVS
jgi:hypothetical protein